VARPLLLFAHGAGAPSSSDWMVRWRERLSTIAEVTPFDYPYMREGRRRPDRHGTLLEAHREALAAMRGRSKRPVVLAGKSMGGRIGCHLALEEPIAALVCLGYPLQSPGKTAKLRDQVLLALRRPVLFVQGTRDRLCPLDTLATVRAQMQAPSELHVVEAGDHSLRATKTWLKQHDSDQDAVDDRALDAIATFIREHTR
jgi:predicted alpha/beta-hydrolase family hydrolase